ncbi:MAG TPA: response regulator [Planctomycetota bacterium]|nr:response regulator [Planctomycetota bacterium]
MKALVVDDSRAIRVIVGKTLKELGFDVVEAVDGKDALEKLRMAGPFDVALVDWNMPELDGLGFVKAARALPEHAAMRILMVTTEGEASRMEAALAAGAQEYMMKPFTRDMLAAKLDLVGLVRG